MADSSNLPFSINPTSFIFGAQAQQPTPMPGRVPVSSFGLTPGQSALGPSHAAFQDAVRQSMAQPSYQSLLQQLIADPAQAKAIGGSQSPAFTPQQPAQAWRLNYDGPQGYGAGQLGNDAPIQSIAPAGNPNFPGPAPAQPAAASSNPVIPLLSQAAQSGDTKAQSLLQQLIGAGTE